MITQDQQPAETGAVTTPTVPEATDSTVESVQLQNRPGFRVKIPDQFLASAQTVSVSVSGNGSGGSGSDAAKPPCPPPSRAARPSRQSRAEQLLLELDADIERERRRSTTPTARSSSADRASDGRRDDRQVSQGRQQRLQTPPPLHYSGGRGRSLDDDVVVVAAASAAAEGRQTGDAKDRGEHLTTAEDNGLRRELPPTTAVTVPAAESSSRQDHRPRLSSEESQRMLDRLLLEKETMATELHYLRQGVARGVPTALGDAGLGTSSGEEDRGTFNRGSGPRHPTLPEYDPDSPAALKRRIVDLEQQISDLQEANETLKSSGARGQQHVVANESRMRAMLDELTVENQALKNEVIRIRQREQPDMAYIRTELDGLRSELDILKDRNYQLERENRRLQESGGGGGLRSSQYSGGYSNGFSGANFSANNPHKSKIDRSRYDDVYWPERSADNVSIPSEPHQYREQRPEFDPYGWNDQFSKPAYTSHDTVPQQQHNRQQHPQQQHHQLESFDSHGRPEPVRNVNRHRRGSGSGKRAEATIVYSSTSGANVYGQSQLHRRSASYTNGAGSESTAQDPASTEYDEDEEEHDGLNARDSRGTRGGVGGGYTDWRVPSSQHRQRSSKMDPSTAAFATSGRQPFAPRQAADIRAGDLVKFTRYGGRISKGLVHFVGRLPGRSDSYVGVELDQEEGKHDGVYDGRRYFQCKPRKGVFVAFNKLIMCYQQQH